jgi:hypothetical protein
MSTAIQSFFELLYPRVTEGYLILSWPSPTRRHKDGRQALDNAWHNLATTSLARIAARAATLSADHSVYFGVAVQHPSRQPNPFQRSQNASAYVMPGLYFDLDLASGTHAASTLPATEAEALAFLQALPSPPSLVVHTGGGLHAYWLFETPVWLQTDAERAAMTHLLKQFVQTLCQAGTIQGWTLDALRDLARVLRPPGTINRKYDKPVTLLEARPIRYTAADFAWLLPLPVPSVQPGRGLGLQDQPSLIAVVEAYGGTLTPKSAEEWHGAHPVHGSSTGVNLDVNLTKGLWHCWRHGTGGDALTLIAVCEGWLPCAEVQAGCLRGALFPRVVTHANTHLGATIALRASAAHDQDGTPPGPPEPDEDDPDQRRGLLAHRLPAHLRDHPDPRVRRHWRQVYRQVNASKQRYSRDPYARVFPSHPEGDSHAH